jgi:protein-S-isoprenylcysteine O-methyltransferase Ste14
MTMQASNWEFKNRAIIIGLIIGVAFQFYVLDRQNVTATLANALATRLRIDADMLARLLFCLAALVLVAAALLRTWASSYLRSDVVYASSIQTKALVADGPYRRVRNPLYFGNFLMAIGMGAMTSRVGFVVLVGGMLLFCYRLILREEAELGATQGESYKEYLKAVPRFWPAWRPRVPAGAGQANWKSGFKAESWYWGFPLALIGFAATLKLSVFFGVVTVSVAFFWFITQMQKKKPQAES